MLVIKAFKLMAEYGELTKKEVYVPLITGGVMKKVLYKVKGDKRKASKGFR